ncbi:MAG: GNAT family N-acetyltransferase [Chloroflexaceae bacterium]|jgi:RimJ/RimL family protein N-acetyltransferase|nr:GNAT family N-acetyltransferase [Chloroflexaceae bacterium]
MDDEPQQPTLTTLRLVLRPFTLADAPQVQLLAGAFEVADTTLHIPHPYPDGLAESWIARHADEFRSRTAVTYAITTRETGELCGAISLSISQQHQRAEMGYWLGVDYWNRGYTTEAAGALLAYGFTSLNMHRVQAGHYGRNPASGRVMQKIGMCYEGTRREFLRKGERFEDIVLYGLLRSEWPSL